MYKLDIARSVEKDIRKINKSEVPKILAEIKLLENNPFPKTDLRS